MKFYEVLENMLKNISTKFQVNKRLDEEHMMKTSFNGRTNQIPLADHLKVTWKQFLLPHKWSQATSRLAGDQNLSGFWQGSSVC